MSAGTKLCAALVAALLGIGLVACGGGDDADSTAPQDSSQQAQTDGMPDGADASPGKRRKGGEQTGSGGDGNEQGGGSSEPSDAGSKKFVPKQHDDSGGGSEKFRVKGGDNSVQEFGEEADPSEFDAAARALHNFLDARANQAWDAACSYLAQDVRKGLEELAAKAKRGDMSCGALLAGLTNRAALPQLREEAARADVGSLRVEGDQAFVIYRGLGDTIMAVPMTNESGSWKVASLGGTPLN